MTRYSYDAIVIGSGPNGLAAAITLARAGYSVLVQEAEATIGGGTRSAELTLPGFMHDLCSAVHPLAIASPFFRSLPLSEHGLEWIHSPAPLAHPFDDAMAVLLECSVEATANALGRDSMNYRRLMKPLVGHWPLLESELLGPMYIPASSSCAGSVCSACRAFRPRPRRKCLRHRAGKSSVWRFGGSLHAPARTKGECRLCIGLGNCWTCLWLARTSRRRKTNFRGLSLLLEIFGRIDHDRGSCQVA